MQNKLLEEKVQGIENSYFQPTRNNVVFCSSLHHWGFSVNSFFPFLQHKFGFNEKIKQFMWGDYYYNGREGKVGGEGATNMFQQFVLLNILHIY